MVTSIERFLDAGVAIDTVFEGLFQFVQKHQKRTFDYKTAFPAADAHCKVTFQQKFQHTDWIDGESVVQAGETTTEEGFNKRFHNIEDDLQNLAKDLAQAYICMAEMRQSAAAIFQELRDEINRLNTDIYNLSLQGKTTPLGPSVIDKGDLVGTLNFQDKAYRAFRLPSGEIRMTPEIAAPIVTGKGPSVDPRANFPGFMAQWVETQANVRENFKARPVTKEEMIAKFGDMQVREGVTVKDIVQILPDGANFASVGKMVQAVADRTGAALAIGGSRSAIAEGFGVGTDVTAVSEAPVHRMEGVTAEIGNALKASGVDTVGALASASIPKLVSTLKKSGIVISKGEAASLLTNAKTLTNIR